jgi:hypothetical protein
MSIILEVLVRLTGSAIYRAIETPRHESTQLLVGNAQMHARQIRCPMTGKGIYVGINRLRRSAARAGHLVPSKRGMPLTARMLLRSSPLVDHFRIASASALLAASVALADPAQPIASDRFGDYAAAITELRQDAGQDRRNIVKANMLLTGSESARFWPLYDADRKARLITEFLAEQNSMSEDQARALANEDFAIEKDTSELRAKWYEKMSKVLSERTVARFFHIDERLDASVDIALAANIPLIY